MLEALGVNHEVELVYRLILTHPTWSIDEVARHLGWSVERTRSALDTLAEFKLVRPSAEGPTHVQPVSPRAALAALLLHTEAELKHRLSQIEASRATIEEFAATHDVDCLGSPEVLRYESVEATQRRLGQLAAAGVSEVLSFQPGDLHTVDRLGCRAVSEVALEHGIKVREIRQEIFRGDAATRAYARSIIARGAEVRTVPTLPMRLVVFDHECAVVPVDPADCREACLELRSAGVVEAIRALFEQFWNTATPWEESPRRDDRGLYPRERELLKLLADGYTDGMAARKLNMSLRTVRRMTASLMERLDAKSRFQAGVNAVQRGWL